MRRLGLISDLHANLDALTAVLADMPPVDGIVCCGDLVEYYDQPNEVCALVRERGIQCIRGNHDAYTIGRLTPSKVHRLAFRTDWTRAVLEETHFQWLESLGTELRIDTGAGGLWIRHANPWDEEAYLRAEEPASLSRLELEAGQTLVVGHTHRPLHLRIGDGWLLNPGSVGQPRDGDPRASYAVVDLDTGDVEQRRAGYDVPAMQQRLERQQWDSHIVGVLRSARTR
jgi:predicted phosphodiesterase